MRGDGVERRLRPVCGFRVRFVTMGAGPTNTPKLPTAPSIDAFKGKIFHSSRWEYDYTGGGPRDTVLDKLADKRVGRCVKSPKKRS